MSNVFAPLAVIIPLYDDTSYLPYGNYITINGKKYPLRHAFTLELPLGPCRIEVHASNNEVYEANIVAQEWQLNKVILAVNGAGNIIHAAFDVEDLSADNLRGFYKIKCNDATENRKKCEDWRTEQELLAESDDDYEPVDAPTPSTPASRTNTRSGWDWFLLIICFFFGFLGVHRFICGKTYSGFVWLFTAGLFGIGWLVDLYLIWTDKFD